jgi:hypothetical protein
LRGHGDIRCVSCTTHSRGRKADKLSGGRSRVHVAHFSIVNVGRLPQALPLRIRRGVEQTAAELRRVPFPAYRAAPTTASRTHTILPQHSGHGWGDGSPVVGMLKLRFARALRRRTLNDLGPYVVALRTHALTFVSQDVSDDRFEGVAFRALGTPPAVGPCPVQTGAARHGPEHGVGGVQTSYPASSKPVANECGACVQLTRFVLPPGARRRPEHAAPPLHGGGNATAIRISGPGETRRWRKPKCHRRSAVAFGCSASAGGESPVHVRRKSDAIEQRDESRIAANRVVDGIDDDRPEKSVAILDGAVEAFEGPVVVAERHVDVGKV